MKHRLDVQMAGVWKPAKAAYSFACKVHASSCLHYLRNPQKLRASHTQVQLLLTSFERATTLLLSR